MARGRKKHAAEKSYRSDDPGGNSALAMLGSDFQNPIFFDVLEGSQLGTLTADEIRNKAAECERKRQVLLAAADDREQGTAEWIKRFADLAAHAVLKHDSKFFRDAAALMDRLASGGGKTADHNRERLLNGHSWLRSQLGRLPTREEAKDATPELQSMDRSQFETLAKELGLQFTSEKLIQTVRFQAEKLRKTKGRRLKVVELRPLLAKSKEVAKSKLLALSDADLSEFCRSVDIDIGA